MYSRFPKNLVDSLLANVPPVYTPSPFDVPIVRVPSVVCDRKQLETDLLLRFPAEYVEILLETQKPSPYTALFFFNVGEGGISAETLARIEHVLAIPVFKLRRKTLTPTIQGYLAFDYDNEEHMNAACVTMRLVLKNDVPPDSAEQPGVQIINISMDVYEKKEPFYLLKEVPV